MKGVLVRIGSSARAAVLTVLAALDFQESRYRSHGCDSLKDGLFTDSGPELGRGSLGVIIE